MSVLDGKKIAEEYREKLEEDIYSLKQEGLEPTIAPILVGDDPGAKVYYRTKRKLAESLGVNYEGVKMDGNASEEELVELIHSLNDNPDVHGLFVELPLPEGMEISDVREEISPEKDIDCINPNTSGKLFSGGALETSYGELKSDPEVFLPATPQAVLEILDYSGISLAGKEFVVIGAGAVGLPLSLLALKQGYSTVTLCEYQTENLSEVTRRADVLCSSVGKKDFVTEAMVSEDTVVIDVGINETESGITGDVDFENVKEKASYITPVPGGVGPMTTTMIMSNTVKAAKALKG